VSEREREHRNVYKFLDLKDNWEYLDVDGMAIFKSERKRRQSVVWIQLAQGRDQSRALLKTKKRHQTEEKILD
jgi:hypothetical protein